LRQGEDVHGELLFLNGVKKNGPVKGPFPLVIPVTVTLDDHRSVAIPIPAAVQSAVMCIELGTGAIIIAVAIVVPVAADPEAEALGAGDCRCRNSDGR